jgi:ribosomal protein S30
MTSNTALSATYVYDAENRLIWTSGDRYVYDGDGKRVEKCAAATSTTACPTSGPNSTLYWRGMGSDTQEETGGKCGDGKMRGQTERAPISTRHATEGRLRNPLIQSCRDDLVGSNRAVFRQAVPPPHDTSVT